MYEVLQRYVGQEIALNWNKPQRYDPIRLLEVTPTRFSVAAGPEGPVFHYSLPFILSIAEGRFTVGRMGSKVTVPVLVQISAWRP